MSTTRDFEALVDYPEDAETRYFHGGHVDMLLAHARSLEGMLKKVEFDDDGICKECNSPNSLYKHAPDCQLAKLLEGV